MYGSSGFGKSALACHFARTNQDQGKFPDGVRLLKMADKNFRLDSKYIAIELAKSYGCYVSELERQDTAHIIENLFANRQTLLIFDNPSGMDDIEKLLPKSRTCSVIITTIKKKAFSRIENEIDIQSLEKSDYVELFKKIILQNCPDEQNLDENLVEKIANQLGYWTFGLKIAAYSIKAKKDLTTNNRLEKYYKQLTDSGENKLKHLNIPGDKQLDYRPYLGSAWKILEDDNKDKDQIKTFFANLSVCAVEGFSTEIAKAVSLSNQSASEYLEYLYTYSFLNYADQKGDRYKFAHPLLRDYAFNLARELSLDQSNLKERHAKYIIEFVESFESLDEEEFEDEDGEKLPIKEKLQPLFEEIGNILLAAKWLDTHNNDNQHYDFGDQLNVLLEKSGNWEQGITLMENFYNRAKKKREPEKYIIFGLRTAKFYSFKGDQKDLSKAERIIKNIKEKKWLYKISPNEKRKTLEIKCSIREAKIKERKSPNDESKSINKLYEKSAKIAREIKDDNLLWTSLFNHGKFLAKQKYFEEALTVYQQVVDEIKIENEDLGEKVILIQKKIAYTHNIFGNYLQDEYNKSENKDQWQEAQNNYKKALEVNQKIGDIAILNDS